MRDLGLNPDSVTELLRDLGHMTVKAAVKRVHYYLCQRADGRMRGGRDSVTLCTLLPSAVALITVCGEGFSPAPQQTSAKASGYCGDGPLERLQEKPAAWGAGRFLQLHPREVGGVQVEKGLGVR